MDSKLKMRSEIEKRLQSQEWGSNIAQSVEKKRKRKQILSSATFGSLATAAILVIAISFNSNTQVENYSYSSLITSQVDGTYGAVFEDNMDIDNLIDETLAMR